MSQALPRHTQLPSRSLMMVCVATICLLGVSVTRDRAGLMSLSHLSRSTASTPAAAVPLREVVKADQGALAELLGLCRQGRERFARTAGYTANLIKQERIGNELEARSSIELKVRHAPYSVYMKWKSGDAGKEVLYVDGANDGRMLVKLGGIKGRIMPAVNVDPNSSIALSQARYPVHSVGIAALTEMLIQHHEREIRDQLQVTCEFKGDAEVDGRACRLYELHYADREQSPLYRKSLQYIDREWNVPLHIENYGWPEGAASSDADALDEATLVEFYRYTDIVADVTLTDADFDRTNTAYRFKR